MELIIIIITVLSIFFSAFLPHCASPQVDDPLQPPSLRHIQDQLSLPTLPRKIRFTEQVREYEARDLATQKKEKKENLSVQKQQRKQNMVLGSKGTRQEWVEDGNDPSQYFTMDYTRVRRRRPVHNKHLPVGP